MFVSQFENEESEFVVGFFKFGKFFLQRIQIWRFLKKITLYFQRIQKCITKTLIFLYLESISLK